MHVAKIAMIATAIGVVAGAAPAGAVITTFATFSAPNSADNFRFVSTGNNTARTVDANFYTTHTATPGSVLVRFSFLEPQFAAYVTNTVAAFTLTGTVAKGSAATSVGGFLVQPGVSGSFSFVTTSAITVGGPFFTPHTYAAGSNLLSGTFTKGTLSGSASSGSVGLERHAGFDGDLHVRLPRFHADDRA